MSRSMIAARSLSCPAPTEGARIRLQLVRLARAGLCASLVGLLAACADGSDTAVDTAVDTGSTQATAPASGEVELARYELNMEGVNQYFTAFRNMGTAMQGMSAMEREALDFDASDTDFNGYVGRLESQPVLDRAIRDAGLTPREFSLVLWSMLQASMANAVLQAQPAANQDSLAAEMRVNMANVRFMREHEAEIRQKQQQLDAELERLGLASDDTAR